MKCWACLPFCDICKPKFYVCPECGGNGSLYYKKCLDCERPMTTEDAERGKSTWREKQDSKLEGQG